MEIPRDKMYLKFRLYGFLKNLRFFDPFIVLFFLDAGLSFFLIGMLYAVREVLINVFEIPTGFVADALGRRKAMLLCFISYLASFAIFFLAAGFWPFALAMVFFALGETFRSGTHKAMILDYLKMKGLEHLKVEYYGRTRSASQLGSAVGALIAIALVFHTGDYRIVFLATMVPYLMELLLMASYPAYLDGDLARDRRVRHTGFRESFGVTWRSFVGILKDRLAVRAILNSSVFDGSFKASKGYLQPILEAQAPALPVLLYVNDQQRVAILVGSVYCVLYLLSSLASRSAGRFASRMRNLASGINITFVAGAVLLLASGLSTSVGWFPLAVITFVGFYMIQNLLRPLNVGYISDVIPSRVMATGLSVESQATTLLVAVLAPIIGYMADIWGVGMALAVTGGIFLLVLPAVAVGGAPGSMGEH